MNLSPTHPAFVKFRAELANYSSLNVRHETGVRAAFQTLLQTLAQENALTLVAEQMLEGSRIRPDGTLRDVYNLPRGYWESKDTNDDLEAEIVKKKRKGYPFTNIVFEDTQKAVLFQNQRRVHDADLSDAAQTITLLQTFLTWQEPDPTSFDNAMGRFGEVIPALATGLIDRITKERDENSRFAEAFNGLYELCVKTLNPHIAPGVVVEMLAQHLLTERLFRTIFDNADFVRRNVIAQEVEKTISVMMGRSFNRSDFTQTLDKYYFPIESKAKESSGWEQKQTFLNTLYERFFQDFSKKAADTQGIVYTPQPIVNFMVESVDALLKSEFGTSLSDKGVVVLDPCVGTGNFMQNLLRRISPMTLEHKYKHELFCNENMLLPYYIASLNIEHAFYEKAGYYEAFPGLCFADTLMLDNDFAGGTGRLDYFSEENAERVQAEQAAPVTVIIGNPPYNVGQMNENENNKNRVYAAMRKRIHDTYVKDSKASLSTKVYDLYALFFRWATDRLGDRDGIVAFVTNNSFLDQTAFDGMRKHLSEDFTSVYHMDLHGNVRQNPKLSGTTHNVFKIQVGVGITILVRNRKRYPQGFPANLHYFRVPEMWTRGEKLNDIVQLSKIQNVDWQVLSPDAKNNWLTEGMQTDYAGLIPIGTKDTKSPDFGKTLFTTYSLGVSTNRDDVVYDFNKSALKKRVAKFVDNYNAEVARWSQTNDKGNLDDFVSYDKIKWSLMLKGCLKRGKMAIFDPAKIMQATYRPFCKKYIYFDRNVLIDAPGLLNKAFPNAKADNIIMLVAGVGNRKEFGCFVADAVCSLDFAFEKAQCFPFYTYDKDGTNRRENITDDALAAFRTHHADAPNLSKQDIFAYIYALLHHPDYRTRYRENLKRELPRIPLARDTDTFQALTAAGGELLALHTGYETAAEYPLTHIHDQTATLTEFFRVEKMRMNKEKTALIVNPYLTLTGIPPEAHDYKLGSRSALEWIIDQYRVKENSDPNRAEEPGYIVSLIKRIVTVSVETVRIVAALPPLGLGQNEETAEANG